MSQAVTLDDKYAVERGRVYITGTQALVRLPMMQRQRDIAAGLNTGGYITGYRGSPLGGFDQALWQAKRFIKKNHIEFQPGLNEDLAAAALWGTQQIHLYPGARYDGVYGMWYGKGPGVDRSGDAFKHANYAGTSKYGGVIALAGDDHMAKSSTIAHQSEPAFMAAGMPVIHPASVQEYLDFGLHAFALSRYCGLWIGFKVLSETVDSSASVHVDPHRIEIQTPTDFVLPPEGVHIRWPDEWLGQEKRLVTLKIPAALAYWRVNRLDRVMFGRSDARFGIVTVGKSYLDTRQALDELGLDESEAERLGIAIYKVGLVWPLEIQGAVAFSEGKREILVIEEKQPLIERQLKDALYNMTADRRPVVVGKADERGRPLFKSDGELTPYQIASAIVDRLGLDAFNELTRQRFEALRRRVGRQVRNEAGVARVPYFCSGCPHNSSTKVPDGSMAMAGIGCHTLAIGMERNTKTFSHMGAEGAPWVGAAHFTDVPHVFQNLGDGTYFHSGYLAIRQAIATNTNITYKILYNDAVAMTGGQPHDGDLHPWTISRQVHAEGVRRIALVSDDPHKYPVGTEWAPGVTFHHRDQLDEVQRELRDWKGVSALIYDQTCAAEKRRRRKRGTYPDPDKRVFINQAVCEGCGDCSVASNCLSVTPVETEFGAKRAVDQSSCNKDFSCLNGFCPSFVSVEGGKLRHGKALADKPTDVSAPAASEPPLPAAPTLPSIADKPYGVLITGIGGTGVVTIGAIMGMAAHIEGKGATVLDQLGMAQKGGAVISHVRIGATPEVLHAVRLGAGGANAFLGCDLVVSASADALAKLEPGVSRAIVNTQETITGEFTRHPDLAFPSHTLRLSIEAAAGADACDFLEATKLATGLMGDSIATNLFMLGYAYQKGLIPIGHAALEEAIELNGTAVPMNLGAFRWGRRAAADRTAVEKLVVPPAGIDNIVPFTWIARTLDEIVAVRVKMLTGFQNAALADRYVALVERVRAAEQKATPDLGTLAEAVARNYAKLLAYKDEYEVARLYTEAAFAAQLNQQFEGDFKLKFHLAPPLFSSRDPKTGHLIKKEFGSWMLPAFRLLAKLKRLRGTAFDPFGYTAERRQERALIGEYENLIGEVLNGLSPANHVLAVKLAAVPDDIKGYGHVKDAHLARARRKQAELLAQWRSPTALKQAAE